MRTRIYDAGVRGFLILLTWPLLVITYLEEWFDD